MIERRRHRHPEPIGVGRALRIYKDTPLDVFLVHYMRIPKGDFEKLEEMFGNKKKGKGRKSSKKSDGRRPRDAARGARALLSAVRDQS